MTPKFKGVAKALALLQHNLDSDAEKLAARIGQADSKREEVFAKSHRTVSAAHAELDGIDKFLEDLDKTNAGPLEGQPRSSDIMAQEKK